MKVAVVGSRNCRNLDERQVLVHLPAECSAIVSGGAAGVDTFAEKAAKIRNIPVITFLLDYKKFGKAATLLRNRQMVENADMVLAFWDYASPGTANTIAECIRLRVPVRIIDLQEYR